MEAHTRIVEALAAREGAGARAAVTDDIMQAADSLARLLVKNDRSRSSVSGGKRAGVSYSGCSPILGYVC